MTEETTTCSYCGRLKKYPTDFPILYISKCYDCCERREVKADRWRGIVGFIAGVILGLLWR